MATILIQQDKHDRVFRLFVYHGDKIRGLHDVSFVLLREKVERKTARAALKDAYRRTLPAMPAQGVYWVHGDGRVARIW